MAGGRRESVLQVIAVDPDLATGLPAGELARARREALAAELLVPRGTWNPGDWFAGHTGMIGLLIVDGLLLREVGVGRRAAAELLGPGDLLRPLDADNPGGSLKVRSSWSALVPTQLVILDRDFAATVGGWPEIIAGLVCRALTRARFSALVLALGTLRQLDDRVLGLLWALADRWGRVRPQGLLVPFALGPGVIAGLLSVSREAVSRTVRDLVAEERLERAAGGCWLLKGQAPDLNLPTLRVVT